MVPFASWVFKCPLSQGLPYPNRLCVKGHTHPERPMRRRDDNVTTGLKKIRREDTESLVRLLRLSPPNRKSSTKNSLGRSIINLNIRERCHKKLSYFPEVTIIEQSDLHNKFCCYHFHHHEFVRPPCWYDWRSGATLFSRLYIPSFWKTR
jgi:hypothetical protein